MHTGQFRSSITNQVRYMLLTKLGEEVTQILKEWLKVQMCVSEMMIQQKGK